MSTPPVVGIPIQFQRLNPFDLESRRRFPTLSEIEQYAQSATAVVGEHIRLVPDDPSWPIRTYEIQHDRSLKLIDVSEGEGGPADATELEVGEEFTVSQAGTGIPVGTIINATDDVASVLKRLLNPVIPPTYQAPTLSLAGSSPAAGNVEFGSLISPRLTPSFNQRDGGALTIYRLTQVGGGVLFTNAAAVAHDVPEFALTTTTTYRAEADHADGPVKNDSEDNPHPEGQIKAGTIQSGTVAYTPQRRSFFGRITSDPEETKEDWLAAAESDTVRAFSGGALNPTTSTTMAVNVEVGDFGAVFAYPATLPQPASITSSATNFDFGGSFASGIVSVEGANGSEAIDYRVLVMINAAPFPNNDTLTLRF